LNNSIARFSVNRQPDKVSDRDNRVYMIGEDGHFFKAINLICADDAAAIESAKQLMDGYDLELWQLDRKVARFPQKPE
jgi:hypothetical protein